MKVSKVVKEYITKMVNEKKNEAMNSDPTYSTYQKSQEEYRAKLKAIRQRHEEEIAALQGKYDRVGEERAHDIYWLPHSAELREIRNGYDTAANEALQEILVTLELGGNKGDLERMLKEIHF